MDKCCMRRPNGNELEWERFSSLKASKPRVYNEEKC